MDPHPPELERLLHQRAWLRSLATQLVGGQAAEDLEQETWLAALRRPPSRARPPRPWLATVARRLARKLRRKATAGELEAGLEPREPLPSTDDLVERVDTERRLAREVRRLAEPYRTTVLLHYWEGLTSVEIARAQGVPEGTVRWRLKRAREVLRERLDRAFGTRESWCVLLVPLARRVPGTGREAAAALGALATGGGGIAMTVGIKMAACALTLAVLLTSVGAWRRTASAPSSASGSEPTPSLELASSLDEAGERGAIAALPPSIGREPLAPPAAESLLRAPSLRLLIHEHDGSPHAERLVVARDDEGEIREGRTDAQGRLELAVASLTDHRLTIERLDAPPHDLRLTPRPEQELVQLPRGEILSGTLLVDGSPPGEPLVLELYRADSRDEILTFHSSRPRDHLTSETPIVQTRTKADGSFVVRGLEHGWRGNLRLPRGLAEPGTRAYADPGAELILHFESAQEGVRIEVERLPSLRGRVVSPDGSVPVPGAMLVGTLCRADGTSLGMGLTADDDGCFELFLERDDWRWVALEVARPSGGAKRELRIEREATAADGELGDLRLAPGRDVLLRVVDPEGRPIDGAHVGREGQASDAEGALRLSELPPGPTEVRVVAPRFVGRTVGLPANPPVPLVVTLEPTNELVLAIRGAAGEPLIGARVVLASSEELLLTEDWPLARGHAGQWASISRGTSGSEIGGRADGAGLLSLWGLRRVPFEVRVLADGVRWGAGVNALHVEPMAPLAETEQRRSEVLVTTVLRPFRALVEDREGRRLVHAEVRLVPSGSDEQDSGAQSYTDASGEVRLRHLSAGSYRLSVRRDGYLPLERSDYRPPATGADRLVLERGLDTVVRVVDPRGEPVDGGRLEWSAGGRRADASETARGRFALRGVAEEPLLLALELAGARYERTVDPREPEHVFTVPEHGALDVTWQLEGEAELGWQVLLLVSREEGRRPMGQMLYGGGSGRWHFPAVLPGEHEVLLARDREGAEPIDPLTQRSLVRVEANATLGVLLESL